MKKYYILTSLLVLALFCMAQTPCWDGSIAYNYNGGDGSMDNPYQIANAEQLALLAKQTNNHNGGDACYILTNDINLANCSGGFNTWTPIGDNIIGETNILACYFTGHFDGNGKTISNLYQHENADFKGLFGCTNGAEIKNLNLVSFDIDNESEYAGALVAFAGLTDIINCNVSNSTIKTTTGIAGGIVGYAGVPYRKYGIYQEPSTISNCHISNVSVVGELLAGGITAQINLVDNGFESDYAMYAIEECSNDADCHVQSSEIVGGIIACMSFVQIENCENNCYVVGYRAIGGICGKGIGSYNYDYYDAGIVNCLNNETGVLEAIGDYNSIGCIVGYASRMNIEACRNTGTGSGNVSSFGGICGSISGECMVKNCINESSFDFDVVRCGGCVGRSSRDIISGCVNYGDISGTESAGGIVGLSGSDYFCGCVNKGNISGGMCAGGLVGKAATHYITNSYNCGNVSAGYNENSDTEFGVGGIIGYSGCGYIYNVYNTGDVFNSDDPQAIYPYYGNIAGKCYTHDYLYHNCYWLDDDSLPATGILEMPDMPGSSAFRHGSSPNSWVLNEAQYETDDMIEALNAGSEVVANKYIFHNIPFVGFWTADTIGENNGYPIVTVLPKYPLLGSEWYYGMTDIFGDTTYQYLSCVGDTTINHKKVKIIVKTNTLYDKGSESNREYIYENNGCVYWWHDPQQDSTLLYDFTANVGDEWTITVGNESVTLHVEEIGIVEYNERVFRSMTVSDDKDIFSGTIVCSVGHVNSFFPEQLLENKNGYKVDGIRCFWDEGTIIYHEGDDDCDAIYEQIHKTEEDDDISENEMTVYPNPTNGLINVTIEFETFQETSLQEAEYHIINIMGETVMSGKIVYENKTINVSNLPCGVYLMEINDKTMKIVIKK